MKTYFQRNGIKILLLFILILIIVFSINNIKKTDELSATFFNTQTEVVIPKGDALMLSYIKQDTTFKGKYTLQVSERMRSNENNTDTLLVLKIFNDKKLVDSLNLPYTNGKLPNKAFNNKANQFFSNTKLITFFDKNGWDKTKYNSQNIIDTLDWKIDPKMIYEKENNKEKKLKQLPAKRFFSVILSMQFQKREDKDKEYMLLIYTPNQKEYTKNHFTTKYISKKELIKSFNNSLEEERTNQLNIIKNGVFDIVHSPTGYKIKIGNQEKPVAERDKLGSNLPNSLFNFLKSLDNKIKGRDKTSYKAFNYVSYLNLTVPGTEWYNYVHHHKNDPLEKFVAGALLLQMDTWKKDNLHIEYGKKDNKPFMKISSKEGISNFYTWLILILASLGVIFILLDLVLRKETNQQKPLPTPVKVPFNDEWLTYLDELIENEQDDNINNQLVIYRDNHTLLQKTIQLKSSGHTDITNMIEQDALTAYINGLANDVANLKGVNENLVSEKESLEGKIKESEDENQKLKNEYETLLAKYNGLDAVSKKLENINTELQAYNKSLTNENAELKGENTNLIAKCKSLQNDNKVLESENENLNTLVNKLNNAKAIKEVNSILGTNIKDSIDALNEIKDFKDFFKKLTKYIEKEKSKKLEGIKLYAQKYIELNNSRNVTVMQQYIKSDVLSKEIKELIETKTLYDKIFEAKKWNDLNKNKVLFAKLNDIRPDKKLLDENDYYAFYNMLISSYPKHKDNLESYRGLFKYVKSNNLNQDSLKVIIDKLKTVQPDPSKAIKVLYDEIYFKLKNSDKIKDLEELLKVYSNINYDDNLKHLIILEGMKPHGVLTFLNKVVDKGLRLSNIDSFFEAYKLHQEFMKKLPDLIDEVWDTLSELQITNPPSMEPKQIIEFIKFYNIIRDYDRTHRFGAKDHYRKYKANVYRLLGKQSKAEQLAEKFDMVNGSYSHAVKMMYYYVSDNINYYSSNNELDFYIDGTDFSDYIKNKK